MVDVWHATVFARGRVLDDDFAHCDTAKAWAVQRLAEHGHELPIDWEGGEGVFRAGAGNELYAEVRLRE